MLKVMFKMFTIHTNTCIQTTSRLRNCAIAAAMMVWSSCLHLLSTADFLSTPSHHGSASGKPFLEAYPYVVVHRIQIWRIRWPHLWGDKLWRLSLQHGDGVTCTMCWCPIFLKNVVIPENRADIHQKHISRTVFR